MTEPEVIAAISRMRRELEQLEWRAARQMTSAYAQIAARLAPDLERLARDVAALRRAGQPVPAGRVYHRLERYRSLLMQVERAFADYAAIARAALDDAILAAVRQAEADAGTLARAALGSPPPGVSAEVLFTALPEEQIVDIVGLTRSGPVRQLLDGFGPVAAAQARQALITGVALGEHPLRVASRIQRALGVTLWRARTIARTEMLRTYRETHRRWYLANSRVVRGWIWHSVLGANSCVACWAMHGKEFPLDEPMGTHPNCRCAMIPKTKTWQELGFNMPTSLEPPPVEPGPEVFARLPQAQQRAILGPTALAAYRRGEVRLEDFVAVDRSRQWGMTLHRASLAVAKENAARRQRPTIERLRQLEPHEVLRIGALPRDALLAWPDRVTRDVVIIGKRRRHYLSRHPEVEQHEPLLLATLIAPGEIHRNTRDSHIAILYRRIDQNHYLRVALWISHQPAYQNSVHSVRVARWDEVLRGRDAGRKVWPRDER